MNLVDTDVTTEVSSDDLSSDQDEIYSQHMLMTTEVPSKSCHGLEGFKMQNFKCVRCVNEYICLHRTEENYSNVTRLRALVQFECRRKITTVTLLQSGGYGEVSGVLPDDMSDNFAIVETGGEGNCFFKAASISLCGSESLASSLRQCCTYEYLKNRSTYDKWLHKGQLNDANITLNRLSKDKEYQGEDSAFILANTVGRKINWIQNIKIQNRQTQLKESYLPILANPRATPLFIYFEDRHFSSILPRNETVSVAINWPINGDIHLPNQQNYLANSHEICEVSAQGSPEFDHSNAEDISYQIGVNLDSNEDKSRKSKASIGLSQRFLEFLSGKVSCHLQDKSATLINKEQNILHFLMSMDESRSSLLGIVDEITKKRIGKEQKQSKYLAIKRYINSKEGNEAILNKLKLLGCSPVVVNFYKKDFQTKDNCITNNEVKLDSHARENIENEGIDEDENSNLEIIETIRDVYNLTKLDLEYVPEKQFKITVPHTLISKFFDFEKTTLLEGSWTNVIQECFREVGLPCGFVGIGGSYTYRVDGSRYCKMYGKCKCGIKYTVYVLEQPEINNSLPILVNSFGIFKLVQTSSTARPLTNYVRRQIATTLKEKKAHSVFLTNFHHLEGLRALHCNLNKNNSSVLRKIRSEEKTRLTKGLSIEEQIISIQKDYKQVVHKDKPISGFIHLNSAGTEISIHTYDYGGLRLHLTQLMQKSQVTTIHLDATSGLFKNPHSKQMLVYHLMGKGKSDITYPVAQMLSHSGSNVTIAAFLDTIQYEIKKIRKDFKRPLADITVCDFSFAMLHGISKGVNHEELSDYINRSYNFLTGKISKWKETKSVIFVCTAHLLNAFKRKLLKALPANPERKRIIRLGLHALARLQESFNMAEFRDVARKVVQIFQPKCIASSTLDWLKSEVKKKKKDIKIPDVPDNLPVNNDQIAEDEGFTETECNTLRDSSPFYVEFKNLRSIVIMESNNDDSVKVTNPYYCPGFLDYLQNFKIPMIPFWCAAVAYNSKPGGFLRETNAVIENHFGMLKTTLQFSSSYSYADYLREAYQYHDGEVKVALSKFQEIGSSSKASPKARKRKVESTDLQKERWGKRAKAKDSSSSKYLSPKIISTESNHEFVDVPLPKTSNAVTNVNVPLPTSSSSISKVDDSLPTSASTVAHIITHSLDDNVQMFYGEGDDDFVLFNGIDGSKLTRTQMMTFLDQKQWLEFCHVEAYCDHLRLKLPEDVQIINAMAVYKVGMHWDGLLIHPDQQQSIIIMPGCSLYLLPVLHSNHWFLVAIKPQEKLAQIFDSGWVACCNLQSIKVNVVELFLTKPKISSIGWVTAEYPITPKQSDGISCGVHVLANINAVLDDPDCPLLIQDVTNKRFQYVKQLLNSTDFGKEMVNKCENDQNKLIEIISDL